MEHLKRGEDDVASQSSTRNSKNRHLKAAEKTSDDPNKELSRLEASIEASIDNFE